MAGVIRTSGHSQWLGQSSPGVTTGVVDGTSSITGACSGLAAEEGHGVLRLYLSPHRRSGFSDPSFDREFARYRSQHVVIILKPLQPVAGRTCPPGE